MPAKAKTFKCDVVKAKDVADLRFSTSLARGGFWESKINLLRGDPDAILKINADDQSSLTQLRTKAKKLGLTLLFARNGEHVFVRAWVPSEDQTRLALLLREPRTLLELRNAKLELNVEQEAQRLIAQGHALHRAGKYQLTEKGLDELVARQANG